MAVEVVREMLSRFDIRDPETAIKALKEVLQEIILFSLYQGGFFESAAFYGGTALRILHGLDRFSEDLDFSLLSSTTSIDLNSFGLTVEKFLRDFEVEASFEAKQKISTGGIASAQIKTEPLMGIFSLHVPHALHDIIKILPKNKNVKIKLEVDTGKARNFKDKITYHLFPIAFPLRTMTLSCLFSGKMHALLCRTWGMRVKGRDWYDCLWFLQKRAAINIPYLEDKLRHSGHWTASHPLRKEDVLGLYMERVLTLDVESAKSDLYPFIYDKHHVDNWNRSLFESIAEKFVFEE